MQTDEQIRQRKAVTIDSIVEYARRAEEYRAQRDELLELLSIITLNAVIHPDARMNGSTDCYAVPLDDIEAARAAVVAILKSKEQT